MHLGVGELLVVLVIVLLVFGGKRLPELGRSLGDAIREFQRSARGDAPGGNADGGKAASKRDDVRSGNPPKKEHE